MQEEQCKWINPGIFILRVKSEISYPVTTGFSAISKCFLYEVWHTLLQNTIKVH